MRRRGLALTPGRYVGSEAQDEDDEPFEEKMPRLAATFRRQVGESRRLEDEIVNSLEKLGYGA